MSAVLALITMATICVALAVFGTLMLMVERAKTKPPPVDQRTIDRLEYENRIGKYRDRPTRYVKGDE